jgi:hypothetical protein
MHTAALSLGIRRGMRRETSPPSFRGRRRAGLRHFPNSEPLHQPASPSECERREEPLADTGFGALAVCD